MSATGNYMNWINVTVTPLSGTAINVTEVVDVEPDAASQQEMFYGDNNSFPRIIRNTQKQRAISITGGNAAQLLAIPDDTPCTVTATLCDAYNGAGSGAITLTLVNAVRAKLGVQSPNNKFGLTTVTFAAFGGFNSGVQVDPLTIAVAT